MQRPSPFKDGGREFSLPLLDVRDSKLTDSADAPSAGLAGPGKNHLGVVSTFSFVELGAIRSKPGIVHTLFMSRRPLKNLFHVEDEVQVSGYLSYYYLKNDSATVGIVFSSMRSNTKVNPLRLVVKNSESPEGFKQNFDLEKLGVVMFKATDSSMLVVPTELFSPLLIRVD